MIIDRAKRKGHIVARAAMLTDYLQTKGIEASLENLEVSSIGFALKTSQKLDGIVEELFEKWPDVVQVCINASGGGGKVLVVNFMCEHPEHQTP